MLSAAPRDRVQTLATAPLTDGSTAVRQRTFWLLLAFTLALACVPIGSSLWLDETETYWIVDGPLSEVVKRSQLWGGQTPLYYFIAWFGPRGLSSLLDGVH